MVEETRVNFLNLDFRDELLELVEGPDSHGGHTLVQWDTLEFGDVHHLWDFDFVIEHLVELELVIEKTFLLEVQREHFLVNDVLLVEHHFLSLKVVDHWESLSVEHTGDQWVEFVHGWKHGGELLFLWEDGLVGLLVDELGHHLLEEHLLEEDILDELVTVDGVKILDELVSIDGFEVLVDKLVSVDVLDELVTIDGVKVLDELVSVDVLDELVTIDGFEVLVDELVSIDVLDELVTIDGLKVLDELVSEDGIDGLDELLTEDGFNWEFVFDELVDWLVDGVQMVVHLFQEVLVVDLVLELDILVVVDGGVEELVGVDEITLAIDEWKDILVSEEISLEEISIGVGHGGGVILEDGDQWVDVLVEENGVHKVLLEGWDFIKALEVDGSNKPLEHWVAPVLTEQGQAHVFTEKRSHHDFLKSKNNVLVQDFVLKVSWDLNAVSVDHGLLNWVTQFLEQHLVVDWTIEFEQGFLLVELQKVHVHGGHRGHEESGNNEGFHIEKAIFPQKT